MLNHQGTKILKTPRLTLRPFTPDDANEMYHNWANDPRVTRYLTWQPHISPEATRALLEMWCAEYKKKDHYNWVIEYEGQAIGNISVVGYHERFEIATLGYTIGYAYWGKGIMTEVVMAIRDYLFDEVGFHRIQIDHMKDNPASGKVAAKCGFTYEGTSRECHIDSTGSFVDLCHYGMLASDPR